MCQPRAIQPNELPVVCNDPNRAVTTVTDRATLLNKCNFIIRCNFFLKKIELYRNKKKK